MVLLDISAVFFGMLVESFVSLCLGGKYFLVLSKP